MEKIYFVTGIDTDAGKSIATGLIAKYLTEKGLKAITQKMVQTGCKGLSEDIQTHRMIMNSDFFPEDLDGTTCPYVFQFPASPDLSASMENSSIDINKIIKSTETLSQRYDSVIIEGVGGIMVPLSREYTVADYLMLTGYPVIIVASARLGSINHTLLTLELCHNRNLKVVGIVYNDFINTNNIITEDSCHKLTDYLSFYYPDAGITTISEWKDSDYDFSKLFLV